MNDVAAQWIVLPPSRESEALRAGLLAHLRAKGMRVVDSEAEHSSLMNAQVVLTSDVEAALLAGAPQQAVTVVRLLPFVDLTGYEDVSAASAQIYETSRKLSAARAFPGRSVADLREIELVGPDFAVDGWIRNAIARPETLREAALRKAVDLYGSGSADWSSPLFIYDERNSTTAPLTGEVDVTGRSRFLISGPYIFLPKGRWRAAVRIAFDEGAARARYHADWGGGQLHVAHEFSPERSGVYEIILDREWDEPGPSELRVALLEGVFHGGIVLQGAHISRIP